VPVAGETPLASRDSTAIAHGAAPGDSLNRADNRMKIPLATRYVDYDNKSHVNNAVYLTYFEIARAHVWREVLGLPDDPAFVLAEATVRYLSPAMLGEPLEIEIRTGEIRTKAWAWEYAIRCTADGRTVAEGSTVQVWFDYERRAAAKIPEGVAAILKGLRD
jgi:acyl-CoA thioester hydrolase